MIKVTFSCENPQIFGLFQPCVFNVSNLFHIEMKSDCFKTNFFKPIYLYSQPDISIIVIYDKNWTRIPLKILVLPIIFEDKWFYFIAVNRVISNSLTQMVNNTY